MGRLPSSATHQQTASPQCKLNSRGSVELYGEEEWLVLDELQGSSLADGICLSIMIWKHFIISRARNRTLTLTCLTRKGWGRGRKGRKLGDKIRLKCVTQRGQFI